MKYPKAAAAIVSMAALLCISPAAFTQVEVEDLRVPQSERSAPKAPPPAPATANATAELHYQLQVLQQEVLQLRGLVEEQAFELKKLKQQRLDDYLDLDRRISQLGGASGGVANGSDTSDNSTPASSGDSASASSGDELASYKTAINLVLKEQKYDEAVTALSSHLDNYPRGRYSANAQYWLGEIFLLKNELESARQWFTRLLSEFPGHTKVPDAQFKLGKVYDMLGDKATARNLLEKVVQSNSNASRLAQDYLDTQL